MALYLIVNHHRGQGASFNTWSWPYMHAFVNACHKSGQIVVDVLPAAEVCMPFVSLASSSLENVSFLSGVRLLHLICCALNQILVMVAANIISTMLSFCSLSAVSSAAVSLLLPSGLITAAQRYHEPMLTRPHCELAIPARLPAHKLTTGPYIL